VAEIGDAAGGVRWQRRPRCRLTGQWFRVSGGGGGKESRLGFLGVAAAVRSSGEVSGCRSFDER
jgi:hypothetical protein